MPLFVLLLYLTLELYNHVSVMIIVSFYHFMEMIRRVQNLTFHETDQSLITRD